MMHGMNGAYASETDQWHSQWDHSHWTGHKYLVVCSVRPFDWVSDEIECGCVEESEGEEFRQAKPPRM
jgi:hypothetical protein